MMGALGTPHTAQHGVVIVRTEKYQPEAKRHNIEVTNAVRRCKGKVELRR